MSISFSSAGSTAGTPTKGLLGNSNRVSLPGFLSNQQENKKPATPSITPFVPGTQKPLPTIFNKTISGSEVPGTPTAAGNAKASGAEYFKGLLDSSNPSERQAGQTWLSHQANPGLLPTHPVSSITTSPDGTTKHTFDTKNDTSSTSDSSSGSNTSDNTSTNTSSSTDKNPGLLPNKPTVGTPTQNAQNVLDRSDLNNNPEYQQGTQNALLINAAQQNTQNAGNAGSQNNLNQTATDSLGTPYSNIFRPQSTANLAGEKGILNPLLSQAGTFATGEQNAAISAGQLATGGAENVLGASTYSPTSYGQTNTSGLTGVQDAGKYGSGPAAAANVQSIKDLTTQYNQGLASLKAADGIKNQIVNTLQTNPDLNTNPLSILTNLNEYVSGQTGTAAQQLLAQQINSYVTSLGIDPASLVSLQTQQQGTLAQLLDSLRKTAQTKNDALNPSNLSIPGSDSSSSSSGSSTGDTPNPWK